MARKKSLSDSTLHCRRYLNVVYDAMYVSEVVTMPEKIPQCVEETRKAMRRAASDPPKLRRPAAPMPVAAKKI